MSHSCEVAQNSPRLKTQHSGAYTTPEGWSSRQTPSAKAIRRLCRGHSRMFETGRAHAKGMEEYGGRVSRTRLFVTETCFFWPHTKYVKPAPGQAGVYVLFST